MLMCLLRQDEERAKSRCGERNESSSQMAHQRNSRKRDLGVRRLDDELVMNERQSEFWRVWSKKK